MERFKERRRINFVELASFYQPWTALLQSIWIHGEVDAPLKEMMRLRTANLAGCVHCMYTRYADALEQGLTEETIARMGGADSAGLDPRERAAFFYATALVSAPEAIAPAIPALRQHLSLPGIAEVTLHTLVNNMFQSVGGVAKMVRTEPGFLSVRAPARAQEKGLAPIYAAFAKMSAAAWAMGSLDIPLKELLRLKSAELSFQQESLRLRAPEALRLGLTEETIAKAADPGRSDLPEREKLALQFGELVITGPRDVTDSFFAELRLHFTESEVIQLCWFILSYKALHRYNLALALLAQHEGAPLRLAPLPEFSGAVVSSQARR